jgi:hypothetical protein
MRGDHEQAHGPGEEKEHSIEFGENTLQGPETLDARVGKDGRQHAQAGEEQTQDRKCQE